MLRMSSWPKIALPDPLSGDTIRVLLQQISQTFNLVCLFCIPVLYALLKINSELHDMHARFVTHVLFLAGIVWAALVVVLTVRQGSEADARANIFALYRQLLFKPIILLLLNLILGTAMMLLAMELVFYRQISFQSNSRAVITISDRPGQLLRLGTIDEDEQKFFRVRVGVRSIFAQGRDGKTATVGEVLIPGIWTLKSVPEVGFKFEERSYETLRSNY